jgi:hypothetical protein
MNGVVPERRVNHEDVCQAEPEESGTLEAGYQIQFLTGLVVLVMKATESKER